MRLKRANLNIARNGTNKGAHCYEPFCYTVYYLYKITTNGKYFLYLKY